MESSKPICKKLKVDSAAKSYDYYIPDDLIIEIFLRLPVESLLKFRSVSKSWRSIICSKQFVQSHLDCATNNPDYTHHKFISVNIDTYLRRYFQQCPLTALLNKPSSTHDQANVNNFGCFLKNRNYFRCILKDQLASNIVQFLKNQCKYRHEPADLIGCCNGLCCVSVNFKEKLFLWNPATRLYRELPPYYVDGDMSNIPKQYVTFGFGFHGGDYKVFAAYCNKHDANNRESILNVYSLRSNSWKRINESMHVHGDSTSGKFANGKLYCCGFNYFGTSKWDIIYYGLEGEGEAQGTVAPPSDCSMDVDRKKSLYLEVLGEHLCLVCFQEISMDVWVMTHDGQEDQPWSKVYGVSSNQTVVTVPRPVWMSREGEILLRLGGNFPALNSTEFMILNVPNNYSCRRSNRDVPGKVMNSGVYVASLVSPSPDDCDLK